MTDSIKCFFAYPANPVGISEVVEKSITRINDMGVGVVNVVGWKSLSVTGKMIISEVCKAIEDSPLFICDLTNFNPNVLFELGYAIAINRRVWITLDTSFEDAKRNYDKFSLLRGIGYKGYQNSEHLANLFFQEKPYESLKDTIYSRIINSDTAQRGVQNQIFYLKCPIDTQASLDLSRVIRDAKIPVIIDDPQENNTQIISWYVNNILNAKGAIVHLLDEIRDQKFTQNAKYSFVAGLIFGLNKKLLMLAHDKYSSPIDFSDLLFVHKTSDECSLQAKKWLSEIQQEISREGEKIKKELKGTETRIALRNLYLGEDQAENEQKELSKYFVPTAEFNGALRGKQSTIYVGRKGSGKTANLFKIAEELSRDRRNHVCVIQPVGYELEGILNLLKMKLSQANPGYMLESLWKFLIYTELAKSVSDDMERHPFIGRSAAEIEFSKYTRDHEDLIKPEFAVRLENAVYHLGQLDIHSSLPIQEAKVSQILHSGILNHLRELIGSVLEDKERVCVIIDNLDKSWIRGTDINLLSDFLFALLNVIGMISEEYNKARPKKMAVRLSLIVFLRSDIFSYIIRAARERDKLAYTRLDWSDPTLLQRIIEERIVESSFQTLDADDVWNKIFIGEISGVPVKEYLTQRIIPRPRDIIYLCKASLSHAVNRGHQQIEEEDIRQAEKEYSHYAFNSLEAELSAQLDHMEELLYEFVGVSSIVTRSQVESFCKKVSIDTTQTQFAIQLLCESTFLGLETRRGYFEYFYPESRSDVIRTLARKLTETTGNERYQINVPYQAYLEIKATD